MENTPRPSAERIEELEQAALRGEIPQGNGNVRQAEENARRSIERLEKRHAAEADQARHKAAIEHRIVGEDVQELNDEAMIEIYGSSVPAKRGTGKDTEDFKIKLNVVDPDSGERTEPTGLLDKMREEPLGMRGRPQAERDKAAEKREKEAKKYEQELLSLVEKDGFELSQAKLIMDLRAKDKVAKANLVEKLKADGGTLRDQDGNEVTPKQKANERYKHLDEERLKLIKSEGVFTLDEYKEAKQNGELARYRGEATPAPEPKQPNKPETPPATKGPETPPPSPEDLDKQISDLEEALRPARTTTLGVDDYMIPGYRDLEKKLQQLKEARGDGDSADIPASARNELKWIAERRKRLTDQKSKILKEEEEAEKDAKDKKLPSSPRKRKERKKRMDEELAVIEAKFKHLDEQEDKQASRQKIMPRSVLEKLREIEMSREKAVEDTARYEKLAKSKKSVLSRKKRKEQHHAQEKLEAARNRLRHLKKFENEQIEKLGKIEQADIDEFDRLGNYKPKTPEDELNAKTAELHKAETRTDLKEEELLEAQQEQETYVWEQLEPLLGQNVKIRDEEGNVGSNWEVIGYNGGTNRISVARTDNRGQFKNITPQEFFELNKPAEDEEQPS